MLAINNPKQVVIRNQLTGLCKKDKNKWRTLLRFGEMLPYCGQPEKTSRADSPDVYQDVFKEQEVGFVMWEHVM